MPKSVNKWLEKGRKNCAKGDHWLMLDYGDNLVCPVCNNRFPPEEGMTEYNCYIVRSPEWEKDVNG